jgi:exopolysaccharide biosynthesis polyprenyl glycosylphosphotransferase
MAGMGTHNIGSGAGVAAKLALDQQATAAGPRKSGDPLEGLLIGIDLLLVCVPALLVLKARFSLWVHLPGMWPIDPHQLAVTDQVSVILLYSAFLVLFCHQRGLHRSITTVSIANECVQTLEAVFTAAMVVLAVTYVVGSRTVSRFILVTVFVLSAFLLVAWRITRRKWFEADFHHGHWRNVLIIGDDETACILQQHLGSNGQLGLRVSGRLDTKSDGRSGARIAEELRAITQRQFVDEIFMTAPQDRELVKQVAAQARENGITLRVIPDMYDGLAVGARIEHIGLFPTISLHEQPIPALGLRIKRVFDILISAAGLAAVSPLLLVTALIVRLDSRGPIFYRSERVGRKGSTFVCYKFRTMVANADALRESLQHLNQRSDVLFKVKDDPRVTRAGRWMRKFSIDELPQLWNVFKGDMSLVGPRPPLPGEYSQYELEHLKRLQVLPGITGLWQVEARQDPSFENYINLDAQYVEQWSLWLDFTILVKTVIVVLAGTGQ